MTSVEGSPSSPAEKLRVEASGPDGLVTASLDLPRGVDGDFSAMAGRIADVILSSHHPDTRLSFRVITDESPDGEEPEEIRLADNRLVLRKGIHTLVYVEEAEVPVTRLQCSILRYLGHPSRVDEEQSTAVIGRDVFGYRSSTISRSTIAIHISRLRATLGVDDLGHREDGVIRTARGVGYRAVTSLGRTASDIRRP